MARHKSVHSPQQASFLEAMLLGIEPETTRVELPDALQENELSPATSESAAPDEAASDLFGFVFALSDPTPTKDFWTPSLSATGKVEQTAAVLMALDALQTSAPTSAIGSMSAGETDGISPMARTGGSPDSAVQRHAPGAPTAQPFLPITPSWLLEHFPELVTHIAAVWNELLEREGMLHVNEETTPQHVAPLLVYPLRGSRTLADAENALNDCLQELRRLAQRLYGSAPREDRETVQILVDRLMQHALREHAEEVAWMRATVEAGVRKILAGESRRIYSAIVVSALQRPFRAAVCALLEANKLPFPDQVLARARQNGYGKVMREALQSLARAGLSLQSASVGWLKAQLGEKEQKELLWKAHCGDRSAVMLHGRTIVNDRIIEHPEAVLIVTFKHGRVEGYYPIQREDLGQAKRHLWSQGYRAEGEEGYPIPETVATLWDDYFSYRESGWWYGDAAGRVMVVIKYSAARKIGNYNKLRRAAATMRRWGYDLRYTDDALYFLPAGIDLPPEPETRDPQPSKENDEEEIRLEQEETGNDDGEA